VGGGVVEAAPHFNQWFLDTVRAHTVLRQEQAQTTQFALVPDRDMAGARGAALAALASVSDGWRDRCRRPGPGHDALVGHGDDHPASALAGARACGAVRSTVAHHLPGLPGPATWAARGG